MPGASAIQPNQICHNCGGYYVAYIEVLEAHGGRLCWCARCGCKPLIKQMVRTPEGIQRLAAIKGYTAQF
ncbi:MAG: hypothetical protein M3281_07235 [Chloroflexota bacterium]|nr:hypothetical protein [Chloroflexota bacterium]